MKLLWIDDEIDLLKPFIYLLQKEGYEVKTAPSGEDGVKLANKESFDLIFLDEIMPGVDGLEVLRKIKSENSQQLVVMVTKSEEENLMTQAYGGWVDDYITKPFSYNQLLSVLNRTLKRRVIIEEKMAEEYSTQLRTMIEPKDYNEWIEYYRNIVSWDTRLLEFGSKDLKTIHEEKKREGNAGFAKYIENQYANFLRGKGPIMSHQIFSHIVFPTLNDGPVYFVIFDSMRLDQYMKLIPFLKDYYEITNHYYYSILPTATPYSRNSIFAGLLPLEIVQQYPQYWTYDEKGQNRFERDLFNEQLKRNNLRVNFSFYKLSSITEIEKSIEKIKGESTEIVIIVINFFDMLIHSIPGRGDLKGILDDERVLLNILAYWFPMSPIFELFRSLLTNNRRLILTTDHGFIRVRRPTIIYGGREISPNLRYKYGPALRVDKKNALLLNNPGDICLPSEDPSVRFAIAKEDYYFIYPTKPTEYEREFKYTFQHGGISTEETILPVGVLKPR
ncbi:MAG: response regulator [candidate division WOR-3 bacterium]|nr:MAG: response regulator [candidate division WOR-3 bacterium]